MKIAITGATGQLGQFVIQHILKLSQEHEIIALVRDIEKAKKLLPNTIEIRHFDYDQPQTLATSLQGIDKLLLISANEIGRRVPQHKAVIDAAKLAQVPYIAYTSLLNADHSTLGLAQEHRETEQLIKDSSLTYTLLRNNWYIENYLGGLEHDLQHGVIYGASGNGKISAATRDEYAEATAKILIAPPTSHANKTYELASNQSFTKADIAATLAELTHKIIRYENLETEAFLNALVAVGLDDDFASFLADVDNKTAHGAMFSESKDLENLLGHPTLSLKDVLKTYL